MTHSPPSDGEAAGPALGPILCGTVTVPDLDEAVDWYVQGLDWDAGPADTVCDGLAQAWSAPRAAGSRYRIVSPGAGREGGVRLVERERPLKRSPLLVPGWRSIELVVSDVDEVCRRLEQSPFRIVGQPKALTVSPSIRAMQAVGPGREMLYLTQTSDETIYRLPRTERFVDRMFIAVLSTSDVQSSFEFYRDTFGADGNLQDAATALEAVNHELGFPVDREHRISAMQLAERSLVEIDGHPPELADEKPPDGDLPGGLACVTFVHRNLDEVRAAWVREPEVRDEAPYLGGRTTVIRGPAGERIELVERAE